MKILKPKDRIDHVKRLLTFSPADEMLARDVIHQAYYSILNHMEYEIDNRLFFAVNQQEKERSFHKAIIDAFINKRNSLKNNDPVYKLLDLIIKKFKRARALRRIADYSLETHITFEQAKLTYLECLEVFDDLEKID